MSRHTLSDGITPDAGINFDAINCWLIDLAPPDTLVGSYYKRNLPWPSFEQHYREHLRGKFQQELLHFLIDLSKISNVTILCVEQDPECCHRRLIIEVCRELDPDLDVLLE